MSCLYTREGWRIVVASCLEQDAMAYNKLDDGTSAAKKA